MLWHKEAMTNGYPLLGSIDIQASSKNHHRSFNTNTVFIHVSGHFRSTLVKTLWPWENHRTNPSQILKLKENAMFPAIFFGIFRSTSSPSTMVSPVETPPGAAGVVPRLPGPWAPWAPRRWQLQQRCWSPWRPGRSQGRRAIEVNHRGI